jgi:glutamine amidotransferase
MRVTVVDSGMGNLHSVVKALQHVGAEVCVSSDPETLTRETERMVLPGVGAFGENVKALVSRDLWTTVAAYLRTGRPFLGICVGMQLLMDGSEEFGWHEGFGVIPGRVRKLLGPKVPHVGWSALDDGGDGQSVYFVHSYVAIPESADHVVATFEYGGEIHAATVRRGAVWGTQFHPEKSGEVGLAILRRWVNS